MNWLRSIRVNAQVFAIAGFVIFCVLYCLLADDSYVYMGASALLAAIAAIGLNLLTGYAGQVSIGNAAFLAVGAYSVVITNGHIPFPLPIIVGALAAGVVGLLIGLPSLRLRGLYLIFSTLALQFVIAYVIDEYDTHTKAIAGHFIASPSIGGLTLKTDRQWFVAIGIVLALVVAFVWNVVRGRPGRAFNAIRANEASAAVIGVNPRATKLVAFTTSSIIVGLAGGIGAYFLQEVGATYYSLDLAVTYVAMVLIGGLASLWGSILGAIIVTMIPFLLQNLSTNAGVSGTSYFAQHLSVFDTLIYGVLVIAFLYFRPAGVASLFRLRRRGNDLPNPPLNDDIDFPELIEVRS